MLAFFFTLQESTRPAVIVVQFYLGNELPKMHSIKLSNRFGKYGKGLFCLVSFGARGTGARL